MKNIGDAGEDKAVAHLLQHNLKIIERNWRADHGELDIIARHKKTIHFVEVKFRRAGLEQAWLAIDQRKQRHLVAAAQQWIVDYGKPKWAYQFDVIALNDIDIQWRQNVIEL